MTDVELKVVDQATGAELGYHRKPEATAEVVDAGGWFHTGDLAKFNEKGYLLITEHKTKMLIVGGANAYPAEIEAVLGEHEKIKQAYVVGVAEHRPGGAQRFRSKAMAPNTLRGCADGHG